MPEQPNPKQRSHQKLVLNANLAEQGVRSSALCSQRGGYAELRCKSNFSFLRGASHPEELVEWVAAIGYAALAITDYNTLAGVVRMHCAAKTCGLKLIVGAEITPVDGPPIALYATDRAAYGRLARIITDGRLREKKGGCAITMGDIEQWSEGLIGLSIFDCRLSIGQNGPQAIPTNRQSTIDNRQFAPVASLLNYRDIFGDRLYLAAGVHGNFDDRRHLAEMHTLSQAAGVPMVATNDVHYHVPDRRFLQDVLTCIRLGCTLEDAGDALFANAERHLKPAEEIRRLFAEYPEAVARTMEIADRCTFSLDELRYEYPKALCPPGRESGEYLAELTWTGAREKYPGGVPDKVRMLIEHELELIARLSYEPYFLTVWDIVQFARSRDILCQGRGSAANSAVCYCLGITSVDPDRVETLFERFVSAERNEPPDIDVDFEHERREEVLQYIYNKYGRDHAGIVAEVITYRSRSAVRDVGKALGLSLDRVDALAKKHDWWNHTALPDECVRECGLDPTDRTVILLSKLVAQILGFPRHLSQHVGGFVITRGPLCEMVPIENAAMPDRTFIEWDKDDIDALGILKVDCLALGMLTAVHRCLRLLGADRGVEDGNQGIVKNRGIKGLRDRGIEGANEGDALGKNQEDVRCVQDVQKFSLLEDNDDGGQGDVSGTDYIAEGGCVGEADISGHARVTGGGTIWLDDSNETSGFVGGVQHCGRECTPISEGLHPFSGDGARLAGRVGNPVDTSLRDEAHGRKNTRFSSFPGNPARTSGIDGQFTKKAEQRKSARRLIAAETRSTPMVCRSSVQSISERSRATDPRSLDPSIPRSLSTFPPEDPAVYDMICRADTIGVFQIESRAQMSMLPRLRPRCYYDLVIEVAIVRPGPIQGGMVHPYLRRRNGEEPVTYPNDAIREVLQRTLGVPLFQEQAMRLAIVAAGFTAGEADQLRRAMAAWRRDGRIERFRTKLIEGMKARGLSAEFAERCFEQICGFGEYGFPESHAASFALLVYASAWLKRYHPAAFCAALLNSQPMGFYQPAQLVRDAIEHGVTVLPVDVNDSGYDCRLENVETSKCRNGELKGSRDQGIDLSRANRQSTIDNRQLQREAFSDPSTWGIGGPGVRLGMRLVKGISQASVKGVEEAQKNGPFRSVADILQRSGASPVTLARLAAADAFRSLGLDRRQALWQVLALSASQKEDSLFSGLEPDESPPDLPQLSMRDVVLKDYNTLGLSLNAHPMSLIREDLNRLKVMATNWLKTARNGQHAKVAGLVLVRQRPSTANGIIFCTIEDETGVANLIIRPKVYEKYRSIAGGAAAIIVQGRVERLGEVIHVNAQIIQDATSGIKELRSTSRDFQ